MPQGIVVEEALEGAGEAEVKVNKDHNPSPGPPPPPLRSAGPTRERIDVLQIKRRFLQALGPNGEGKYWSLLRQFFAFKLSKHELDELIPDIIGAENLALHNQLIKAILHNAAVAAEPPPNIPADAKPVVRRRPAHAYIAPVRKHSDDAPALVAEDNGATPSPSTQERKVFSPRATTTSSDHHPHPGGSVIHKRKRASKVRPPRTSLPRSDGEALFSPGDIATDLERPRLAAADGAEPDIAASNGNASEIAANTTANVNLQQETEAPPAAPYVAMPKRPHKRVAKARTYSDKHQQQQMDREKGEGKVDGVHASSDATTHTAPSLPAAAAANANAANHVKATLAPHRPRPIKVPRSPAHTPAQEHHAAPHRTHAFTVLPTSPPPAEEPPSGPIEAPFGVRWHPSQRPEGLARWAGSGLHPRPTHTVLGARLGGGASTPLATTSDSPNMSSPSPSSPSALPDLSTLRAQMLGLAYEQGLRDVSADSVGVMHTALEQFLKSIVQKCIQLAQKGNRRLPTRPYTAARRHAGDALRAGAGVSGGGEGLCTITPRDLMAAIATDTTATSTNGHLFGDTLVLSRERVAMLL
eukprot:jgi/Chlat1/2952/Chrsp2S04686